MRQKTINNKIFKFFVLVLAAILHLMIITGCSNNSKPEKGQELADNHAGHDHGDEIKEKPGAAPDYSEADNHGDEHQEEKAVVRLSDAELKEFGIQVAQAGTGSIEQHVNVMGEIVVDPSRVAHMSPRFPGVVREVRVGIGDRVKKNQVLAIIESNESLVKYRLTSAINGTVIAMHMSVGENALDNSHDVTVADLSVVWARFSVYQEDLFHIKPGQPVTIKTNGQGIQCEGSTSYISPVVDETTRTASARVVLENGTGQWKPGMFVAGSVLTSADVVPLVVPQSALLLYNGQYVVMVKDKEGFHPQPVRIGLQNDSYAEILSGLKEGQTYVSKGAFLIKAELQKESFGHGHSH